MTKLVDTGAGTFTATYDPEGRMITAGLPDGLITKYTYNPAGTATSIEYEKKAHCEKTCPENLVQRHGCPVRTRRNDHTSQQPLKRDIHLQRCRRTDRNPGSHTKHQNLQGPTIRLRRRRQQAQPDKPRINDRNMPNRKRNRRTTRLRRRKQAHRQRSDLRLTRRRDEATSSRRGQIRTEKHVFNDGQVATQTQHEQTIEYFYDPSGRTRETISKGTSTYTNITHYAGQGKRSAGSTKAQKNGHAIYPESTVHSTPSKQTAERPHCKYMTSKATLSAKQEPTKLKQNYRQVSITQNSEFHLEGKLQPSTHG